MHRRDDGDDPVRDHATLYVGVVERDHVADPDVLRRNRAVYGKPTDGDRRRHRARIDRDRPVAAGDQSRVEDGEGDGRPRTEANRHLAHRPEGPPHRSPYACVADQVNVVLADRPWRALSPASVPVVGKLT